MGYRVLRVLARSVGARRACALLCAAAALLALHAARAPAALSSHVSFAHAQPARVAHLLADFSTHPSMFSEPVTWSIEKEASNYTSWRYSVSYECGARCAGRADVHAHENDARAPRHGLAARAHHVLVRNVFCVSLPLVPWPQLCAEIETVAVVRADEVAGGAVLEEHASVRCGPLAALALRAHCSRSALRALRDAHLQRVRLALQRHPQH